MVVFRMVEWCGKGWKMDKEYGEVQGICVAQMGDEWNVAVENWGVNGSPEF